MGDKSTARETMKKAGVPTVPGSDGLLQVQDIYEGQFAKFISQNHRLEYGYVYT